MIQRLPVHDLLANLEAARLAAIKELARFSHAPHDFPVRGRGH
jgi:hypothetical protein